MYSTSILSNVANKLQTLMGKRKLILTLGVIAVCIQSAMASSQDPGPTVPAAQKSGAPPTLGRQLGIEPAAQKSGRSESAPGRTPPASTHNAHQASSAPAGKASEKGAPAAGGAAAEVLKQAPANTSVLGQIFSKQGLAVGVGAGLATMGGIAVDEALSKIGTENTHQEVFTVFGDGIAGNCIGVLIGLALASGIALIVYGITMGYFKHQNFSNWMTGLSFASMSFLMIALNFMQQDAANAGVAFGEALIFKNDWDGHGPDGEMMNFAEFFSSVSVWLSFILIFAMAVVGYLYFKKYKGCGMNFER